MILETTISETVETNIHNAAKQANVELMRTDKDTGLVYLIDTDNRNRVYSLPLVWGVDYSKIKTLKVNFV